MRSKTKWRKKSKQRADKEVYTSRIRKTKLRRRTQRADHDEQRERAGKRSTKAEQDQMSSGRMKRR